MARHTESGWLAFDAEIVERGIAPATGEPRALEPVGGEFTSGVGHVLAAEHAEPQHLFRGQFRPELRIEIAARPGDQLVAIALLHAVVNLDDTGPLAHLATGLAIPD